MLILIIFVFGIRGTLFSQAQPASETLDLEACIAIALNKNSQLKQAQFNNESAEWDVLSSYKGILPSISLSTNNGKAEVGASEFLSNEPVGIDPETGNVIYEQRTRKIDKTSRESNSANVTLRQNIFDGGIWWGQIHKYSLDKNIAVHNLNSEINAAILSVESAYYDLIKQQKLSEVNQMAVEKSEAQLARTQKMFELGATAQIDVYRAKVNLGNDKIAALSQKNTVFNAKKQLNIAMGRNPLDALKIQMQDVNLITLPDLDELVNRALNEQPQMQVYKQDIEAKKTSVSMAKGVNSPQLSAYVNYNRSHEEIQKVYTDFDKNYQLSYGLSVNFNIFNGLSDYVNVEKAVIAERSSKEAYLEYKRNLVSSIHQYYSEYNSHLEIIELNAESHKAALEEVRLAEERYRIGAGTSLEVREAHVNLIRAEQTLIAAQYNAMSLLAQIENQLGNAYTNWIGKVNP
jgi:outer membrane protein TolC